MRTVEVAADSAKRIIAEAEELTRTILGSHIARVTQTLKQRKSHVFVVEVGDHRLPVVAKLAAEGTVANEFRMLEILRSAPLRGLRALSKMAYYLEGSQRALNDLALLDSRSEL